MTSITRRVHLLGSGGEVHLCFSQASLDDPGNGSSAVYVVNAGHPCDGDYPDTLTMNQTGPQGLAGPVGPAGPQGPAGPAKSLDDGVKGKTLGDLKQVGKQTGKTEDKLDAARKKLDALEHAKGNVAGDALARQQQAIEQMMIQLAQQIQALKVAQMQTIHGLLAH